MKDAFIENLVGVEHFDNQTRMKLVKNYDMNK